MFLQVFRFRSLKQQQPLSGRKRHHLSRCKTLMALYTILSKTQIAKLLQRFQSLPPYSFRTKGIALGTVNTYYRITYKRGEVYYLKIDEIADELRLQNEIRIFVNLARYKNFLTHSTPMPLTSDTGLLYIHFRS